MISESLAYTKSTYNSVAALKLHVIVYLYRDYNYSYNVYHGVADYGKYPCSEYRDDSNVNTLYNTNGHHSRYSNNDTSNSNNRNVYRIVAFIN